jgi:isopenicillin-N epimerase
MAGGEDPARDDDGARLVSPPFGREQLAHWPLDPAITYLNHGTVGVTPLRVLAAQQRIRDEAERQPARFLIREQADQGMSRPGLDRPRIRAAADAVAEFVRARGDDLVFVDNATTGANAVIQSLELEPGDEILATDFGYGAVTMAAGYVARRRGASVRVVEMPWPPERAAVVRAIEGALGPRTKLAIVDHVTSETAVILPLAEIAAVCRARGVPILADGAHAPGQLDLDLPSLGVDAYTGNLHKWAWSPRSCAILWVAPAWQPRIHPTVISWNLGRGFTHEFDWIGTRDASAVLAAPDGIAAMRDLGLDRVRAYNHDLAWRAARLLAERWGTTVEQDESCVGSMVMVPLPPALGDTKEQVMRLRDALLYEDRIEVQAHAWRGRLWVRVSAQVYNEVADVERLADCVLKRTPSAAAR